MSQIIVDIQNILNKARKQAYQRIHVAMVQAYWLIGKRIVEEDQQGNARATYGKALIANLSTQLTKDLGQGFSQRNLEQMRAFYLTFVIPQTASAELQTPDFQLSWSHYLMLMGIKELDERRFYEIESIENKTIGIILCQKKSDLVVEITLPENNDQIFASRYQTVLPSNEQLRQLLIQTP